jgi:hypothetical protein
MLVEYLGDEGGVIELLAANRPHAAVTPPGTLSPGRTVATLLPRYSAPDLPRIAGSDPTIEMDRLVGRYCAFDGSFCSLDAESTPIDLEADRPAPIAVDPAPGTTTPKVDVSTTTAGSGSFRASVYGGAILAPATFMALSLKDLVWPRIAALLSRDAVSRSVRSNRRPKPRRSATMSFEQ